MARQKWGQHFLRDDATARRLVAAAGIEPGETILEIGPGTGRLTRALLEVADRVLALEVDPRLAAELPGRVEQPERLTVIEADAARDDLADLMDQHLGPGTSARAMGNLPYESATVILTRLLALRSRLLGIGALVQREVAERIVSAPGSRSYGYFSVVCQDVAEARLVLRLKPGAFRPPPRVHSAMVTFTFRETPLHGDLDERRFLGLVGGLFRQRRKTILNNLQAAAGLERSAAEQVLTGLDLSPRLRPEDLSPQMLVALACAVHEATSGKRPPP